MDAFQRGLSRQIPLEKAASFFVGLKSWQPPSREDDELLARAVKEAGAALAPPPVVPAVKLAAPAARLPDLSHVKSASVRFRLMAALLKTAGDETVRSGESQLSSPTPAEVPPEQEYLANEAAGRAAEESNAVAYYQQCLESARAETAAAQQQVQELEQQLSTVQQAQEQHDSQVQAAQQEGQIAQQAALQQVQSANQQATQAMQQAVDAENRALQAKGQEATAKIQQQQVRSQLFDLASQGLPGTEPELGGEGNAAQGLAPEQPAAGGPAVAAGSPEGTPEGDQAATDNGAEVGGGTPGAGLNEAGEPASGEGMPGQEAAPEGAGAAAGATAVQPPGDSSGGAGSGSGTGPQSNSDGSASAPEQDPSAKRTGQVSIKVGRALTREESLAKIAAALPSYLRDPRVLGALAGGALGAGAAGLEATGHGPDLGKLRARVSEGESAAKQPGLKGFGAALDLAKDRVLLTLGEATQDHPVAATITGGLIGAKAGLEAGPRLTQLAREATNFHK